MSTSTAFRNRFARVTSLPLIGFSALVVLVVVATAVVSTKHNGKQDDLPRRRTAVAFPDPKTVRGKVQPLRQQPVEFVAGTMPTYSKIDKTTALLEEKRSSLANAVNVGVGVQNFDPSVLFIGDSVGGHLWKFFTPSLFRRPHETTFSLTKHSALKHQTAIDGSGRSSGYLKTYCMPRLSSAQKPPLDKVRFGIGCEYNAQEVRQARASTPNYDVLVYRLPWPHFYPEDIRIERDYVSEIGLLQEHIDESLSIAHQMFGVKIAILLTSPYSNNVALSGDEYFARDNNAIRSYVANYAPPADGNGIRNVLLMEWEKFVSELIIENGRLMGLSPGDSFRVKLDKEWPPLAAMICPGLAGITPKHMDKKCAAERTKLFEPISVDGMHLSGKYVRPRSSAVLLCLAQCAYSNWGQGPDLRGCQDACNGKYMSLLPVNGQDSRAPLL